MSAVVGLLLGAALGSVPQPVPLSALSWLSCQIDNTSPSRTDIYALTKTGRIFLYFRDKQALSELVASSEPTGDVMTISVGSDVIYVFAAQNDSSATLTSIDRRSGQYSVWLRKPSGAESTDRGICKLTSRPPMRDATHQF